VYIVDRLAEVFASEYRSVTARHSGLPGAKLFQPRPQAATEESASGCVRHGRPRVQVACATPAAVITCGSFSPLMNAKSAERASMASR